MTAHLRKRIAISGGLLVSVLIGAQLVLGATPALAVTSTFNVTTTADIAVNAGACGNSTITTPPDPSNLSLREAVCLANNVGGTATVSVPAGTYTLSHGELDFGTASAQNVTLSGAGAATTIITADGASRVLNVDVNLVGGITAAVSGVTITGGTDSTFGGAGIIAGSGDATTADSLDISHSTITDNHANGAALTETANPGGGVQFIGGTLTIEASTISDNSSKSSPGSGVAYAATGTTGSEHLTISGTTFSGNTTANTVTTSLYDGGALDLQGPPSTAMTVTDSTFTGNTSTATGSGGAAGAAIRAESGTLSVTGSTFTGNSASGGSLTSVGGAIEVTTGTATIHDNRIVGNTAAVGSALHVGVGAGTVNANDNWFGCNTGPNTSGCDTVNGTSPSDWLTLTGSASPQTVVGPSGLTTVSGSFLTDSANNAIAGTSLSAFENLAIAFTDPEPSPATIDGGTSASETISSGQANGLYNSQTSSGNGHVVLGFDNASVTVAVTVDRAPVVTTNPTNQTALAGSPVTFMAAASGFPAPTVQWQVSTNGGSSFSDITGAQNTTYTHNALASENGNEYQAVFTNSVTSATTSHATLAVGQAPAFTSGTSTAFDVGVAGSFAVTTSGQPDATLSTTGTLPSWLHFTDNGDGTGSLTGTPPADSGGAYTFGFAASNGVSPDASQSFTLDVDQAPAITSADSTTFSVGDAGTFTVTTTAGFPTTTAISETGALPSGVTLTDNGDGTATLAGTPATGTAGVYPVSITAAAVGGDASTSASQSFTLTIDGPPSITSANSASFALGAAGTFTVTTTPGVPSSTSLSETGALPTGVTLTDNGDGTATLAGTPAGSTAGSYPLTIKATNGSGHADQSFTLTVTSLPSINSADSTSFSVGIAGTFTVTTTAGFPAATTLSETGALPGGVTFTDNGDGTATLAGTPAADTGGMYGVTVRAANSAGHTDQSFTLTVLQSPAIASADHTTFAVGAAGTFTVTTTAGFPAATSLTELGALPTGVTFTDNGNGTATLAGTPTANSDGTYPITIKADNGEAFTASQSFTLTVTTDPTITSADSTTFGVGSAGSFTVTTMAGFPASTALSETGALPSGVTFTDNGNGTATLAGTPAGGTGGTYPFTVTATNTAGHTDQSFTLTVLQSPAITSADHTTFAVGTAGTFTVTTTAGFPAATSLTELGALPTGVTLTDDGNGTATLAGTPAAGTGGSYPFSITASNGQAPDAVQSFTLTVTQLPSFTSPDSANFAVGDSQAFLISTDAGFPAATALTETGALPSGVTFTDNGDGTATLEGAAAAGTGGEYPLTLTATNTAGHTDQSFTLTVLQSPAITSADAATFTTGMAGTFTVTTTAGFPVATSLSETAALPSGVTFADNGDGTATLAGTPQAASGGMYSFTITASNGSAPDATQSFTLTVDEPPAITSAAGTSYTVGTAGTFTVTTTGFPAASLSEAGALPSGVTFTNNGNGTATLAGTPAAGSSGDYPMTISASNGIAPDATQTFELTVAEVAQTITVTSMPPTQGVVGGTYPVAATSDSGLTVQFSIDPSTTNSACSLSGPATVSFDHAGSCVVAFNQPGDGTFAAAPTVKQTISVVTVTTGVSLATTPTSTVFGQGVTATATITASSGTPAGTVQFEVDGNDLGSPVAVSGGTATSGQLTDSGGGSLAPGSHAIAAFFTPTDTTVYATANGSDSLVVSQAGTTTSVVVGASTVTATVAAVAPGAGTPSGSVAFSVDGSSIGSASLSGGVATLSDVVPAGKTRRVTAVYGSDTDFSGSSGSTARHDPSLTAKVTSAHARTRFGWYRSAVTVRFHCTTNGAPLTGPCPSPVTVRHAGGGQSVTRTIMAIDGGVATRTVKPINIDLKPPRVHVTGITNGAIYDGAVPVAHCVAHDALSEVASCVITRHTHGTTTTYKATATDRAGNKASVTGSYTTLGISFEGVTFSHGAFNVKANQTYILVVQASSRPTYYDAAPYPTTPFHRDRTFIAAGHDRWALGITMLNLSAHRLWNLGVKIGGVMHVVTVSVT